MITLRYSVELRDEKDHNINRVFATEHFLETAEEAKHAGEQAAVLVSAFMVGLSEADTSDWVIDEGTE